MRDVVAPSRRRSICLRSAFRLSLDFRPLDQQDTPRHLWRGELSRSFIPHSLFLPLDAVRSQKSRLQSQPAHQRRPLPDDVALLLEPVPAFLAQHQVEVPKKSRQNEPHLVVGKVPTDAIPGTDTEGLVDISVVVVEGGCGVGSGGRQPALRHKSLREVEVTLG